MYIPSGNYYTLEDIGLRHNRISKQRVYQLMQKYGIAPVRIGNLIRYDENAFKEFSRRYKK